jgi:beta-glucosidase
VRNTGERDGADVVQVYAGLPGSAFTRPARRLIGFGRVDVPAGATASLRIELRWESIAVRDDGAMRIEPGAYRVEVSRFAGDPDAITFAIAR